MGSDLDGEAGGDLSGSHLSLSADGNYVAIAAQGNDDGGYKAGHVRVFAWEDGAWQQRGSDIDGGPNEHSGSSISINSDGTIVAIGAPWSNNLAGCARVYQWNCTSASWQQVDSDIGGAAGDRAGQSVSISSDGTLVAVSSPWNDDVGTAAGAVRVYQNDGITPAPCPTTTTTTPAVVSGRGDPHLVNMRGEHFDLYRPGNVTLLRLPRRAGPAGALLLVEADARRMGDACSVYFQVVTISGMWANQTTSIRFLAQAKGTPDGRSWKEWMRFGPIYLKVTLRKKGVEYINVYARNVAHGGYEVGGLLGLDDHEAVARRPRECTHRHAAVLMSSVADVS